MDQSFAKAPKRIVSLDRSSCSLMFILSDAITLASNNIFYSEKVPGSWHSPLSEMTKKRFIILSHLPGLRYTVAPTPHYSKNCLCILPLLY